MKLTIFCPSGLKTPIHERECTDFQNCKRSLDPKYTPIVQNFNVFNASTLYVQSANQIWNVQLYPLQIYGLGQKNVEMGHMTTTPSTWGIVKRHKADTSRGQQVYEFWSL